MSCSAGNGDAVSLGCTHNTSVLSNMRPAGKRLDRASHCIRQPRMHLARERCVALADMANELPPLFMELCTCCSSSRRFELHCFVARARSRHVELRRLPARCPGQRRSRPPAHIDEQTRTWIYLLPHGRDATRHMSAASLRCGLLRRRDSSPSRKSSSFEERQGIDQKR